jgi:hypothetical protein
MQLTEHFSLKELTYSQYAVDNQIDNKFDSEIVDNLLALCVNWLEPFRLFYGKPIRVTSGYRSEALNTALGGSKTSAHFIGSAVDMQPVDGDFKAFVASVKDFIDKESGKFDQCLIESNKTTKWVHLGLFNRKGEQRCMVKSLKV